PPPRPPALPKRRSKRPNPPPLPEPVVALAPAIAIASPVVPVAPPIASPPEIAALSFPPDPTLEALSQLAPRIADLPMKEQAPAPLLMDVTPHSLGLETAGGYCQSIVPRNAPVPAEKSRVFSTGRDDQEAVEVRICQGESLKFQDNQLLGTLILD